MSDMSICINKLDDYNTIVVARNKYVRVLVTTRIVKSFSLAIHSMLLTLITFTGNASIATFCWWCV